MAQEIEKRSNLEFVMYLWKRRSRSKVEYLGGEYGPFSICIFPNQYKTKNTDGDFRLLIGLRKKEKGGPNGSNAGRNNGPSVGDGNEKSDSRLFGRR